MRLSGEKIGARDGSRTRKDKPADFKSAAFAISPPGRLHYYIRSAEKYKSAQDHSRADEINANSKPYGRSIPLSENREIRWAHPLHCNAEPNPA